MTWLKLCMNDTCLFCSYVRQSFSKTKERKCFWIPGIKSKVGEGTCAKESVVGIAVNSELQGRVREGKREKSSLMWMRIEVVERDR